MGTQNSKERYLELWDIFEKGISANYNGSMRAFALDYSQRAEEPEEFEQLNDKLKAKKKRNKQVKNVKPYTIEDMEKYCKFLKEEKLYTQELLDDEYIFIE